MAVGARVRVPRTEIAGEADAIIQTGLAVEEHPVGLPQRLPSLLLRAKASLVREESMDRTCCHWL